MRNIGPDWRSLAEGHLYVEALEAQFRAEWSPRIEEAWRKRSEAEKQKYRRRGRVALGAATVLALLFVGVALVLLLLSSAASSVVFTLAIVVPAPVALVGGLFFLHTTEPLPDPSDVSARWWRTIERGASSVRAATPNQPARYYGDVGEVAFLSRLSGTLPDGYVAVRGLLVNRHLDADVVVVGPMGVGVYEVKNWTGQLFCQDGQWHRIRTYRGPGGDFVREYEEIKPFDRQWIKEAGAVKEALRLGFPEYRTLHGAVGGGIVFTHEGASFSGDGSCRARVYKPGSCAEALLRAPAAPDFTMEKRLRVVDALLRWSDRLHQQQGEATSAGSAVELAERLHRDAVSLARRYLSEVGEASGEATAPATGSHEGPSESPKIPA